MKCLFEILIITTIAVAVQPMLSFEMKSCLTNTTIKRTKPCDGFVRDEFVLLVLCSSCSVVESLFLTVISDTDYVIELEMSGLTLNQVNGLAVDSSDGSVYFTTNTAVYKKGERWDVAPVLLAGDSQNSGFTDGSLLNARFQAIEVRFGNELVACSKYVCIL